MAENKNIFQQIVDAFQDLSDYMDRKWWRAMRALIFLIFAVSIGLLFFYGYRKIDAMEGGVTASLGILESTHPTPASLQEDFVASVQTNVKIDRELLKILYGEMADKVLFFKFHNTKTDLQGKHDFFYSGVNEVLVDGMSSSLSLVQDIPITRLGTFVTPMLEKKCESVKVGEIETNDWLKEKLKDEKIDLLITCPVYDVTGKFLIGFTELIYNDGNKGPADVKHAEEDLKNLSNVLSDIVSVDIPTNNMK